MDDRESLDLESLDLERIDLGAVLRAARRRADLSQRELALRSGFAQPFVARIESGAVGNPTFRTIERLLQAAGVTSAHLDAVVTHMEAWQKAGRDSSAMQGRSPSDTVPSDTVPSVSFVRLRSARDERRARYARGAAAMVVGPAPGGVRGDGRAWGQVWTARLDCGEVVGKLWAHEFDDLVDGRAVSSLVTVPPGTMVLDGVVVAEDWRQLGIGRRLVGALRSASAAAVVTLVVGNALESFLMSCGFEPTRSLLSPRWLVSRAV